MTLINTDRDQALFPSPQKIGRKMQFSEFPENPLQNRKVTEPGRYLLISKCFAGNVNAIR